MVGFYVDIHSVKAFAGIAKKISVGVHLFF
jgi:hypothetical protein